MRVCPAPRREFEDISEEIYRWENALVVLVGDRGVIDKALEDLKKNGRARGGEPLEGFRLPGAEYFNREGLPEAAAGGGKE